MVIDKGDAHILHGAHRAVGEKHLILDDTETNMLPTGEPSPLIPLTTLRIYST